jgi:hypothetical protein
MRTFLAELHFVVVAAAEKPNLRSLQVGQVALGPYPRRETHRGYEGLSTARTQIDEQLSDLAIRDRLQVIAQRVDRPWGVSSGDLALR